MRITGRVVGEQTPEGPVCQWEGGRFAVVNGNLIRAAHGLSSDKGRINLYGVEARVIRLHVPANDHWTDNYVVMQEGRVARAIARYWQFLLEHIGWWGRRWKYAEGEEFPKWSVLGILCRPFQIHD